MGQKEIIRFWWESWVAEPFSKWGGTSARQEHQNTIEKSYGFNWQL